jgi:radical SAM superfamily enzyme YgiQ (UPF0313 family)
MLACDHAVLVEDLCRAVKRFGVRDVALYDDALLIDAELHLLPLLERVRQAGVDLRFHTPNGLHLHLLTEEIARALKAAGFVTLRFGLETVSRSRLAQTGPKYATADVGRALHALRAAGFADTDIGMYILMGLPGQTPDEVRSTIAEVRERYGVRAKLAAYAPVPGTALWPASCDESLYDLKSEPLWHNNTLLGLRSPVFSEEMVRRLRREAGMGYGQMGG